MKRTNVLVVLSGCGLHDGTEVSEAAFALLAIERSGATPVCAAPDVALPMVVDHQRGDVTKFETRSAVVESARIARSAVQILSKVDMSAIDAVFVPGGYGATKVLCDYAMKGRSALVNADVAKALLAAQSKGAPIGVACAAGVLAARVFGDRSVRVTVGNDALVAADCASWGAKIERCDAKHVVVDRALRVVSTPAFSATDRWSDAFEGIERAVKATLELR